MQELSEKDVILSKKLDQLSLDFWDFKNSDTKELTHGIHNYPAMMIYPISRNIIKIMKEIQSPNILYDPFMGSGTVLVEGLLEDMEVYGTDLNPLAKLISETKTQKINSDLLNQKLTNFLKKIETFYAKHFWDIIGVNEYISYECNLDITEKNGWGSDAPKYLKNFCIEKKINVNIPEFKNIGYWFTPKTILELSIIKKYIEEIEELKVKNIFNVTFSEIIRLVSNRRNGEFKLYRMPPTKINSFNPEVKKLFIDKLKNNINKTLEFQKAISSKKAHIFLEDTKILNSIPNNTIELLITSPPYGDSRTTVAYGQYSRLSLQWLDIDNINIDKLLLGGRFRKEIKELFSNELKNVLKIIEKKDPKRAKEVHSFYSDLDISLNEISKKMKKNSYQFWVVGNRTVKKELLKTNVILTELASKYDLLHIKTINRNIPNKIMPSLNSPTNIKGEKVSTMTNEHIVIFRKI